MANKILTVHEKVIKAIVKLIQEKPFYGFTLQQMRRRAVAGSDPVIKTFAVSVEGGLTLWYNEDFAGKLNLKETKAVLEHEVLHIVHEHFDRAERSDAKPEEHQVWNIAMDMAINQYIENLPKHAHPCVPKPGWQKHKQTEYYVTKLKELQKQQKANGQGSGQGKRQGKEQGKGSNGSNDDLSDQFQTIDDHGMWGGKLTEEEKVAVKEIIREAYEQSQKSQGYLPGNVASIIEKMLFKPLPWYRLLRRAISEEISSEKEVNWSRPNRRQVSFGFDNVLCYPPGFKRKPECHIYVAMDTSGSVPDKDLAAFLNEIDYMFRSVTKDITLIQCDAKVNYVEKYNGKNRKNFEIVGRGGTSFVPVFDYLKERKKPGMILIYFTDGYGDAPSKKPPYKTIWVYTKDHHKPCNWGTHIVLNNVD